MSFWTANFLTAEKEGRTFGTPVFNWENRVEVFWMYEIILYNFNKEEEESCRAVEAQGRRVPFCPCFPFARTIQQKWCLQTPLQKVTCVHSSCSLHNQSFLLAKRPGIHAGFGIAHSASCWPTPLALAPTQRKKASRQHWLCSETVTKASGPRFLSCLCAHLQYFNRLQ